MSFHPTACLVELLAEKAENSQEFMIQFPVLYDLFTVYISEMHMDSNPFGYSGHKTSHLDINQDDDNDGYGSEEWDNEEEKVRLISLSNIDEDNFDLFQNTPKRMKTSVSVTSQVK